MTIEFETHTPEESCLSAIQKFNSIQKNADRTSVDYQNIPQILDAITDIGIPSDNDTLFIPSSEILIQISSSMMLIAHLTDMPEYAWSQRVIEKLSNHIQLLFSNVESASYSHDRKENSCILLNNVFQFTQNPKTKETILRGLEQHLSHLINHTLTDGYAAGRSISILLQAKPELQGEFLRQADELYKSLPPTIRLPKWYDLFPESGYLDKTSHNISVLNLSWLGFTNDEALTIVDQWEKDTKSGRNFTPRSIRDHIMNMSEIDRQFQGSVPWLTKTYGIHNFGRYPSEMIMQTLNSHTLYDAKWVLVLYPCSDHNGAFEHNIFVFNTMLEQLNVIEHATNVKYVIRVLEYENATDLIKRYRMIQKQFVPQSLTMWGGHGSFFGINAGYTEQDSISWQDIHPSTKLDKTLASSVNPSAPWIMVSCSTGKKYGFAQKLSELGTTVYAPNDDADLIKINLTPAADQTVEVKPYYHDAKTKVYSRGKLIKSYSFR